MRFGAHLGLIAFLLITLSVRSFAAANWVKFPGPTPEWTNWIDANSVSREGALTTFDMLADNKRSDPITLARNPNSHNKIGFNCKSHTLQIFIGATPFGSADAIKDAQYEQIYQFICKAR